MDERMRKLAHVLVNNSCKVVKGDKVYIHYYEETSFPIVNEVIKAVHEAGGIPFAFFESLKITAELLKGATKEQIEFMTEYDKKIMNEMDCYIAIRNTLYDDELSKVPEENLKMYKNVYKKQVHTETRLKKRWVVTEIPNEKMATNSGISLEKFKNFYYKVCTLDYSNLEKSMKKLVTLMDNTDKVRIVSKNTDVKFSIKGIPSLECSGERNIPDGEVYTAPVKDSINGYITYNTPSIENGIEFDEVFFEIKNGKVINCIANRGKSDEKEKTEQLENILNTDKGSRYFGEFALGLNPYIKKPMKNILFDEKIAGSFHLTIGNAYDTAPNNNSSSIHWNLVQIQAPEYGGGEIYFDDVLIRKDGKFVLSELYCLNPENLV